MNASAAIRSADRLIAALAALPSCPADKIRVYRGQTSRFDPRPSGLRRHLDRNTIWSTYSRVLAADIGAPLKVDVDVAELAMWGLWIPMLAQHYGAGSNYLDVTYSPEIATWFALNAGQFTPVASTLGPPGPPSPEDLPSVVEWLEYSPFAETAFLFAFDVPAWNMEGIPERGDLVDLALGPELYRSPRVLAQRACLIRADRDVDDGKLMDYIVQGTPLELARPWTSSEPAPSVDDIFPSPTVDSWFKRFLSVPMLLGPDPSSGTATLRRPLPVMAIQGSAPEYNQAVIATEAYLPPALLHKALRYGSRSDKAMPDVGPSTPILIEAPVFVALPSAESEQWNHDLLRGDIDDEVPCIDIAGKDAGRVSLRDTLVQFSTLEVAWWSRWADSGGAPVTRGIRLIRDDDVTTAYLILQEFGDDRIAVAGPVEFRFDPSLRRFVWRAATDSAWKQVADLSEVAKPSFVALHYLRVISVTPSAQPYPSFSYNGGGERTYLLPVTAGVGKLVRVTDPHGEADAYVVRTADGEPYTNPAAGSFRTLEIKWKGAFADYPARSIRDAIAAQPTQSS